MAGEPLPSRRHALMALTAVGVGTLTGLAAGESLDGEDRLSVTRTELVVAGWPPGLHGLSVALLTDLHHSDMVSRRFIDRAVDLALAQRPDLVLLGGDYVSFQSPAYVASAAEALGRLRARHGVFAVLGNHDDERLVPTALARRGIELLRDERTRLAMGGESIDLVGLSYWTRRAEDIARIAGPARGPRLLLAHDPRRFREARDLGFPLLLSGHTHGGQIVVPGLGPVAARKFPVASGALRQGGTTLFVSRGVGTVYVPVRLNCPPEVSLLTLVSKPSA